VETDNHREAGGFGCARLNSPPFGEVVALA